MRLDPTTLAIVGRTHLDASLSDLVVTDDAVWALDYRNGVLCRLDPTSLAANP